MKTHFNIFKLRKTTSSVLIAILCASLVLPAHHAQASTITDSALEAIKANQALADQMAKDLVARDFNIAFQIASNELSAVDQSQQTFVSLLKAQNELVKSLESFASLDADSIEKSASEIARLNERYEDLVRLRFDLSWVPTDVGDKYRMIGPLLKDVVSRFKARCDVGRSDVSFTTEIPHEPAPPKYQFEFMVNFNDKYPTASYAGLNYVDDHKERKAIIQAAGLTAATSGSILLTAATGTSVAVAGGSSAAALAAASAAFPVASVVLVTAIAVQHFANMKKANEIAAEVARAESLKFEKMKRDDYIAEKYRELCKANVVELNRVAKLVSVLEKDNAHSRAFIAREVARKGEMQDLNDKMNRAEAAQCRLFLSESVRKNECATEQASAETKAKAVCEVKTVGLVKLKTPAADCEITAKSNGEYGGKEADKKIANDVKAQDAQRLVYHKLIISLGENRAAFMDNVSRINWSLIDELKERSFVKLMEFNSLARKMNQAGIGRADSQVRNEVAASKTLEGLKGRFVDLTGDAIRVTFARGSADGFRKSFRAFNADFEAFFRKHRLVKEVQALGSAVRELERIMNADS